MNQPLDYQTPENPKRHPWMLIVMAAVVALALLLVLMLFGVRQQVVPAPVIGPASPAPAAAPASGGGATN